MFGHHKAKREKRRLKREKEAFADQQKQWDAGSIQREKEHSERQKSQVEEKAADAKKTREEGYAAGRKRVEDLYNDQNIKGLSDEKRNAMQYEANKAIQRSHQSANRKLLGDQSMRGIGGQGGVGYAQQKDLLKLANEAQGGVHRDLDKLNEDLRMKNIAAIFAGEQGEASQYQLDKQLALDELKLDDERKRQRQFEDQFSKLFSRI